MSNFFRELDQKDLVDMAKKLYEVGVRREWQELDEYVKDTTVTYLHASRAEIFRYHGEFMETEGVYFIPTLEDVLAFLVKKNFTPNLEYFTKGKWRITWMVGGNAEGLTPRLAALRAMEELLRIDKEAAEKENQEEEE